jgi:hypothetical protein
MNFLNNLGKKLKKTVTSNIVMPYKIKQYMNKSSK